MFIDVCLNSLAFKELESSKFLIKQFEDSIINTVKPILNSPPELNQMYQDAIANDHTSENFFMNNHGCFNNLIQFDLQPHDPEEVNFLT